MPSLTLTLAGVGLGVAGGVALGSAFRKRIQAPKRQRDWGRTFTVCQYNVLGDGKYAAMDKYDKYCSPADRAWNSRFPRLMSEMDAYAADIYCLEEVQHAHFRDSFKPAFEERGYTPTLCSRKGKGQTLDDLNVMIATRDSSIRVLDVRPLSLSTELRRYMESSSRKHLDVDAEWLAKAQAKDNEVLVALCEHISTRSRIVVACTHLHWDPREPEIKSLEAAMLCGILARTLEEWGVPPSADGQVPLILCGDFNSQPSGETGHGGESGVHRLLTQGELAPGHPDHPASRKPQLLDRPPRDGPCPGFPMLNSAGLVFQSAYRLANGEDLPYTTRSGSFCGTLDYIFVPRNSPFRVVDTLSLPDYSNTPTGMPDKKWPSDHFALAAVFKL